MSMIILVFIFMLLVMLVMSVGIIFGRKPIAGSCGGLSSLGMKSACDVCGGVDKCEKDEQVRDKQSEEALFYDATDKGSIE